MNQQVVGANVLAFRATNLVDPIAMSALLQKLQQRAAALNVTPRSMSDDADDCAYVPLSLVVNLAVMKVMSKMKLNLSLMADEVVLREVRRLDAEMAVSVG